MITRADFESKKKTEVSFLIADTTKIRKKNGVIELPCDSIVKRYVDKPDAEEQSQEFTYVGYFPLLNKYVLTGVYYEDSDYKLVDKLNGKEISLEDYPRVSGDKKYLITISANGYDNTGDIGLYSIENNAIKLIMSAAFKNWMPASEKENSFWSNDGYLYVPVIHAQVSANANGPLTGNYQYIRIRVL